MSGNGDPLSELTAADLDALRESAGEFRLDTNAKGEVRPNLNNAISLIEHSPDLKGTIWFDEFLCRIMTGSPPREWRDVDDLNLTLYMQRNAGVPNMAPETVSKAALTVAHRATRNCVKDFLNNLAWDGVPRIDHFFADHFGAKCTEYVLAASRNFWIAMCARIYQPGCKFDNIIVLEGKQGVRKSSAMSIVGGKWYMEQKEDVMSKDFFQTLEGIWLVEIGEMDSFSRADVQRVKLVASAPHDRYRASYGRHAETHPRQCVFVCTTNKDDWGKDDTGARRFWPIACNGIIDVEAISAARSQLFAESVFKYKAGATWWEMPEIETLEEQRQRYDSDIWQESVESYVKSKAYITVNEILIDHLRFQEKDCTKREQMRVTTCLRSLGWTKTVIRTGKTTIKAWLPPSSGNG